jgi:hypothetical protein
MTYGDTFDVKAAPAKKTGYPVKYTGLVVY